MAPRLSPLLSVPQEILEHIALDAVLHDPLGLPIGLVNILLTCRAFNSRLSFRTAKDFYAHIFKGMFDVDAARRRLGSHAVRSRVLADQLRAHCITLKRIRHGDIYSPTILPDFWHAFLMLMENDGKNRAQLDWAQLGLYVDQFVRVRLWEERRDGWPVDSAINSLALWLMWCTTDSATIARESLESRTAVIELILPFLIIAFRYPAWYAPDTHFRLPLPRSWQRDRLTSIHTVHGPYPHYRAAEDPGAIATFTWYGDKLAVRAPPLPSAAKLLYFARREIIKLMIAPELPVDYAHALALGVTGSTQADVREFNTYPAAHFVSRGLFDWKDALSAQQRAREEDGAYFGDLVAESVQWDNDWERLNNCWDPWSEPPLKGSVYTPGTLTGLWQGRMLVPTEGGYFDMVPRAEIPPDFSERAPYVSTWPVFMRLQEHHSISPQTPCNVGGDAGDVLDDGVRNAWFPSVQCSIADGNCEVINYEASGGARSVYETFAPGKNSSHTPETCQLCSPANQRIMRSATDGCACHSRVPADDAMSVSPPPTHADFEDEFTRAGFGAWSSDDDDELEDVVESTCMGVQDIIFTGETDAHHGSAWGAYTFLGRIRMWDGLVALVRVPKRAPPGAPRWVFRGYVHYGRVLAGSWRGGRDDVHSVPYEGPFLLSKRDDA